MLCSSKSIRNPFPDTTACWLLRVRQMSAGAAARAALHGHPRPPALANLLRVSLRQVADLGSEGSSILIPRNVRNSRIAVSALPFQMPMLWFGNVYVGTKVLCSRRKLESSSLNWYGLGYRR